MDALMEVAKKLGIAFTKCAYGGKKDRHADTTQYITIEGPRQPDLNEANFSTRFIGFMGRPMGPDLIDSNRFQIMVRNLGPGQMQQVVRQCVYVGRSGYPNYFDDQRFGSYDPQGGFIAEKILKGHFNGAVKIYLTAIHPEDKSGEKQRKRFFIEHWQDWQKCAGAARTVTERLAFASLKSKDYEGVLRRIPREDLSMFISAYQSFIWNELVRRLIKKKAGEHVFSVPGAVGDYVFFKELDKLPYDYLKKLNLPTAAHNAVMPDKLTQTLYEQILKEREVTKPLFNKIKLRQAFFKSHSRAVLIKPSDLSCEQTAEGVRLKFILPRGSYATILVKRLFAPSM